MDKSHIFIVDSVPNPKQFEAQLNFKSPSIGKDGDGQETDKDQFYEIARLYSTLLRVEQIIGVSPFRIITKKEGKSIFKLEFKKLSGQFLYFMITGFLMIFLIATYFLNRELDIDLGFQIFRRVADADGYFQESSNSTSLQIADRTFQIIVPIFALINITTIRIAVLPLMLFVNNWSKLLKDFEIAFGQYYEINLSVLKNFKKRLTIVLFFSYMIPQFKAFMNPRKHFLASENLILNLWIKSTFLGFISTAFIMSNLITILSLLTVRTVFKEICQGIQRQYAVLQYRISQDQVSQWNRLILATREQVDKFQQFSSAPELNDLFFFFASSLCILYTSFSMILENAYESGPMIPYAAMSVIIALTRTYIKGYLAEMVKEEEQKIGIFILSMKMTNNTDSIIYKSQVEEAHSCRMEMQMISNMIFSNPTQIIFGNIIVLNKKLLLSVVGNLASYLVVFLQFQRPASKT